MVSSQLVVSIDGVSQLQYDRNKPLQDSQRQFLDRMDVELRNGVVINGQLFNRPDMQQRGQFVAVNLIQAIQAGEEQKAVAMCSYLAIFLPDLKQVKAEQSANGMVIDLVFDNEYVNEVKVELTPVVSKKQ